MTVSALRTTTSKPSYDGTRMGRVKYLNVSITTLVRYTHGEKNGQPNNNFESLWEQLRNSDLNKIAKLGYDHLLVYLTEINLCFDNNYSKLSIIIPPTTKL